MYIDPEDIPGLTVRVNDEVRQVEDGEVALCLPYGEYSYIIEAPGYRPEEVKEFRTDIDRWRRKAKTMKDEEDTEEPDPSIEED